MRNVHASFMIANADDNNPNSNNSNNNNSNNNNITGSILFTLIQNKIKNVKKYSSNTVYV